MNEQVQGDNQLADFSRDFMISSEAPIQIPQTSLGEILTVSLISVSVLRARSSPIHVYVYIIIVFPYSKINIL